MPLLSRIMIRSALLWMGATSTLGALLLLQKGLLLVVGAWAFRSAHVHMALFGWIVQLACGVAFWILPRLDSAGSRGDERPVWVCWGLLNAGVLLVLTAPIAAPVAGALHLVAALCHAGAVAAFALHAWPRVRSFREEYERDHQASSG
jgi:nitric oxide reductase large subunit